MRNLAGRRWTEAEKRYAAELRQAGMLLKEIAPLVGRSVDAVSRMLIDRGRGDSVNAKNWKPAGMAASDAAFAEAMRGARFTDDRRSSKARIT